MPKTCRFFVRYIFVMPVSLLLVIARQLKENICLYCASLKTRKRFIFCCGFVADVVVLRVAICFCWLCRTLYLCEYGSGSGCWLVSGLFALPRSVSFYNCCCRFSQILPAICRFRHVIGNEWQALLRSLC